MAPVESTTGLECGGGTRPVPLGGRLGLPPPTVHAVLTRCWINRLSRSPIHTDVTKFGNIPDGAGWRYVGKNQRERTGP